MADQSTLYAHDVVRVGENTFLYGLMAEFDPLERQHFEEFVMAYVGVAQHVIDDDELVSLLEIFRAYGFKRALAALHDIQDSKVPLSPRYLETVLEKSSAQEVETGIQSVASIQPSPARVRSEFSNPLAAEVATLYQREIGDLTAKVSEQLIALVEDYPDLQKWHQAFQAAATMNKRSLAYVVGCLRNNGQKKVEGREYGQASGRVSKSKRNRQEKQRHIKNYEDYWNEDYKASQKE